MQLKQTAMNLSRGKTAAIEAEVLPETASEKGVRYAIVSGPEIVTLHHDGTVTGKAVGTAKISVTSWITRNWCAMSPFLSPLILSPAR